MSDEHTTLSALMTELANRHDWSGCSPMSDLGINAVIKAAWQAGRDYQRQQAGAAVNDELVKALETIGAGDCGSAYAEMPDLDCLAMQQASRDGTLTPNWRREHQPYFESGDHFCNRCRARDALARARGER